MFSPTKIDKMVPKLYNLWHLLNFNISILYQIANQELVDIRCSVYECSCIHLFVFWACFYFKMRFIKVFGLRWVSFSPKTVHVDNTLIVRFLIFSLFFSRFSFCICAITKHLKIVKTMQVSGIIICVEIAEWNIYTFIKQSFYTIN